MNIDAAKENFISTWGTMSSSWGINKTMAQVHALLLVSPTSLSTDEIMDKLSISRGNANMNLRSLIDWGLVSKVHKIGERREYFEADKDPWSMAIKIAQIRKQRELEPMLRLFAESQALEYDKSNKSEKKEAKEFKKLVSGMENFAKQSDKLLKKMAKANETWLADLLLRDKVEQ